MNKFDGLKTTKLFMTLISKMTLKERQKFSAKVKKLFLEKNLSDDYDVFKITTEDLKQLHGRK